MGIKSLVPMPVRMAYRDARSLAQLLRYSLRAKGIGDYGVRFMSNVRAVDCIVKEGKSMARFGDGEFGWILGMDLASSYQKPSPELALRLREVLNSTDPNLVIGILKVLSDDSNMNFRAKSHWRKFKVENMKAIVSLLDFERVYADSSITRPYIDLRDRSGAPVEFENLKRIWAERDVLLVEGEESRLGVGNDLFDGAISMRRVLCPSCNAFASYDAILAATLEEAHEGDMVLIALGPTATVLAYDLFRRGLQAVDIGHIDNEYEWMLMGAKRKVPIPGKAVDEVGSHGEKAYGDKRYEQQIVKRVI